jgi:hypothetical protein
MSGNVNVAELMSDPDFTSRFTVRTPRVTVSDEGIGATAYDERVLLGIVQPAEESDIKSMPEGTRVDDMIAVWCADKISASDGKSIVESAVIVLDGPPGPGSFRVVHAEDWSANGYFFVLATGFVTP